MSEPSTAPRPGEPAPDESLPLAGLICIVGLFFRLVLSDPLLNAFGMHYSGDTEGSAIEKIHPGTYFFYLSLFVLLWEKGNPLAQINRMYREYRGYTLFLCLYLFLFVWQIVKSTTGMGVLIDTHIPVAVCAVVLSYAPRTACRWAVNGFVFITALNSLIGIAESLGRFRIFTFDPTWTVLHEDIFRASALFGHPLTNAMVTDVAIFIAMGMRYGRITKALLMAIFLASLVAFGGRGGIALCILGLIPLAFTAIAQSARRGLSMQELFVVIAAVLVVPLCIAGGLFVVLNSDMGERLMAMRSMQDESAEARLLAFKVFGYMTTEELVLGTTQLRIVEIAYRMGLSLPLSDIENPWILMLMSLGIVVFAVWLPATVAFAMRLMRGQPLALKIAVAAYYIVASTSNSFGRKDSTYVLMVGMVVCAGRALGISARRPEPDAADEMAARPAPVITERFSDLAKQGSS
jgi:hypothetical protein